MSIVLQVIVIVFCVALTCYVFRLVAKEQLLLKYSLLWLVLAVALLVSAVFPDALFTLSNVLGFETPSNFIFFVGLFCLLAIALSLSVIASKQTIKIKNLTQRIALLEFDENTSRSLHDDEEGAE
ncbi:hypothetical protein B5G20_06655 [Collinsella sp. An7]|uniref:DUF2304 domain-containing protein n=1 Tax=Collinsella sp. An7 TaxID=1965651 RepID=UPI000B396C47|nr:DUF2304 domain-containing protein [Collinsella sp. An7]OUN46640.1 hypothetical protein B5G20_06655 [Collinsella sp. An7]